MTKNYRSVAGSTARQDAVVDASGAAPATVGIAAVERDTGLSKDTLRVWERRYGFPRPQRDAFGERAYCPQDLDKLRVIRRLLDAGHRPGKIIAMPIAELRSLADAAAKSWRQVEGNGEAPVELERYLDLVRSHRIDDLRRALSQSVLRLGIERFVIDVCAPLNRSIGEEWARGDLEIYEEHLYTESMQVVLRNAIGSIPEPATFPRVLLTTVPNEAHGLGLLMAEALLALEGCHCTSLGTQTPIGDIALAAATQGTDIVALSFSACLNPNQVLEGLAELRARLSPETEIWAGGRCPILQRRPPKNVTVLGGLTEIREVLAAWRSRHAPA
jgi:DNA-binding transcriptional MerR regulator/methylmalonyl-CoA mutase cobalamin-binding subunit